MLFALLSVGEFGFGILEFGWPESGQSDLGAAGLFWLVKFVWKTVLFSVLQTIQQPLRFMSSAANLRND